MPPTQAAAKNWTSFVEEMRRPSSFGPMNWPNFVVVGAQKAGTTSLYTHLRRHPEVFLPRVKEVRMFQPEHPDSATAEEYRELYAEAKAYKAIGEVTPFYIPDPLVPARIREVSPDAKIIMMLRDPVERAYSHYLNAREVNVGASEPAPSFRAALKRYEDRSSKEWPRSQRYIEQGMYCAGVRRFVEAFGGERVLVLLFNELARDAAGLFARIARHIGVDPDGFSAVNVSEKVHPYRVPKFPAIRWIQKTGITAWLPRSVARAAWPVFFNLKKPPLDNESRRKLQAIYEPDIRRLEELLGREMPELRGSWV